MKKGKDNNNYKHGMSYTRLYKIWCDMKVRCLNKNNKFYKNYGGRGIKVCKVWHDFINFKEWALNNGYDDTLTIDRINSNGDYEPTNCQWITKAKNTTEMNKRTKGMPVKAYNLKTGWTMFFSSMSSAGRNGYNKASICACIKGINKTHAGCV